MFGHRKPAPVHHRAPLSREARAVVWDRCGGRCTYCGRQMNPFRDFTVDHIVPVYRGGTDDPRNLAGCCKHCNSAKGTRTAEDFRRRPLPQHRRHRGFWRLLVGR